MRYPFGHKQRSTEQILAAAAALFRRRGYVATGVDRVMGSVKLTAGSFYTHFRSKKDLLAHALDAAFEQSRKNWPEELERLHGRSWLHELASFYLSAGHRDTAECGCPMPSLTPEIHRVGGKAQAVFQRRLQGLVGEIAKQFETGSPAKGRKSAIASIALCVGGVQLARVVMDEKLSNEILEACREAVIEMCSADSKP